MQSCELMVVTFVRRAICHGRSSPCSTTGKIGSGMRLSASGKYAHTVSYASLQHTSLLRKAEKHGKCVVPFAAKGVEHAVCTGLYARKGEWSDTCEQHVEQLEAPRPVRRSILRTASLHFAVNVPASLHM